MKTNLYIAIDSNDLDSSIELLESGISELADVIECGGGLVFRYGVKAIEEFKKHAHGAELVADIKMIPALAGFESGLFFESGADGVVVVGNNSKRQMTRAIQKAESCGKKDYVFIDLEEDQLPDEELLDMYKEVGVKYVMYHTVHGQAPYWREKDYQSVEILCNKGFEVCVTGGIDLENVKNFKGMKLNSIMLGSVITKNENPIKIAKEFKDIIDSL